MFDIDSNEKEAKEAIDQICDSDGARVSDIRDALERLKEHIDVLLEDY